METVANDMMLSFENVNKTFHPGTVQEKRAITDLNFQVKRGDFVTVIGGNGAGKSTLMNLISGSLMPDTGRVVLDGQDITRLPEYKRAPFFGRVFQDPLMGTAPDMEMEENLALAARKGKRHGLAWEITKEERETFREAVASLGLGLEDRLHAKVGLLSGGQRQAITLLMATIKAPKMLLLDEHTAALDPHTAARVLELTEKTVRENALTTLMITHNMADAIRFGNRLLMFGGGRLLVDVSGEEKKALTVPKLLSLFEAVSGGEGLPDSAILG